MNKTMLKSGKAEVTFELPAEIGAQAASVCGDCDDWVPGATPLAPRKAGRFSATLTLAPGRHRFRYLLGDGRWENDWAADDYQRNAQSGDDSVVVV
jgi:1,4-alpha-glucan branching enzyme